MNAKRNIKRGFTIAEMLVALAVMALLLTAVAIAFNASAINYGENQDIFNAINTGRQAMLRMTNQLRTANSVATAEANTQCSFFAVDGKNVRFIYDSAAKTVYIYPDLVGTPTVKYTLCRNVTAMAFTRTTGLDSHGVTCVKGVQLQMTIAVGGTTKTISSAAVVRKTLS